MVDNEELEKTLQLFQTAIHDQIGTLKSDTEANFELSGSLEKQINTTIFYIERQNVINQLVEKCWRSSITLIGMASMATNENERAHFLTLFLTKIADLQLDYRKRIFSAKNKEEVLVQIQNFITEDNKLINDSTSDEWKERLFK